MPSIALTFGDTVKSFPALANTRNRRVQRAVKAILSKTASEVIARLEIPGRDYNDRTWNLRRSWKRQKMRGRDNRYKWRISNRMFYASFIENGTRYITPRKMLHREIENGRARLRRRLRKLNRKVLQGAFL